MQENIDFKNLYDQYVRMVFNLCLKYLQSIEDAEDVTQEVFITVFKSIHQFKGESKISTWIYKIAITKSLEFIRMKKRKKRFAFFQSIFSDEKGEINISDVHFHHPGIQLENKERAAILFNAIDKLPENQKAAYILCKLEDLSYNEIAEIMKVTVPSVESLLFRAKQNLQKILGNYYEKNEK